MFVINLATDVMGIQIAIFSSFITLIVCFITVSYNKKIADETIKATKENLKIQLVDNNENTNKNLQANIITKSRIEWLQVARQHNIDFEMSAFKYADAFIVLENYRRRNPYSNGHVLDGMKNKYRESKMVFLTNYFAIKMLYPIIGEGDNINKPNKRNTEIIENAKKLYEEVENFPEDLTSDKHMKNIENLIDAYIACVYKYSKEEWIKVKSVIEK